MKAQLWVVLPFSETELHKATTIFGRPSVKPTKDIENQVQIFTSSAEADIYASDMSKYNGGRSYLILETTRLWYAAPSQPLVKQWINGELIPT